MGGVFGKNKRLRVFPKGVILYKTKGKKTSGTTRVFRDASTWTGENHFHSARIGRTPKGPEPSVAELALDTPESEPAAQAKRDGGEQAASLCAQDAEGQSSVTARDAQDVEVSQDPEAKPGTEVMQHQELTEQTTQEAQSARSPWESSKTAAVLHPAGGSIPNEQLGCEDHEVIPLTQTTVKAEVHVSADVQGGLGKVQSAIVESELLTGAEPEAGVVCVSEETCVGKTHREVPVQKAADSSAALCTTEELERPWKTTEAREGITNVQRSAEELAVEEKVCCAAKAPPDLQLEQDTEVPVTEDMEEKAFEPEQAEEMAEVCDDGQTPKEIPSCLAETQAALQDKEKIKASNGGKPEEC
ncbi:hypothetical protein QYF61_008925 [Mycteria americana]|uniref:Uncharacterized protein n=1 Tax=Mycteria americana TaxID=33587 RepID=A0AAN7RVS1_MYCAM|nr:hypothetical protein QYF61_008925 [Mycteria americana]